MFRGETKTHKSCRKIKHDAISFLCQDTASEPAKPMIIFEQAARKFEASSTCQLGSIDRPIEHKYPHTHTSLEMRKCSEFFFLFFALLCFCEESAHTSSKQYHAATACSGIKLSVSLKLSLKLALALAMAMASAAMVSRPGKKAIQQTNK